MPNDMSTVMDLATAGSNTNALSQMPFSGTVKMHLNKRQKAAIIVRLLLAEGAEIPLQSLPEGLQSELINQMSAMRFVDRATLKAVIEEFAAEIEDIGLSFPEGIEGALDVLEGSITPATATRMRKLAGIKYAGDPWTKVGAMEAETLLPIVEKESTEVAAVLLSKLKVSVAAEILGKLPGPQARKIAYAVSLTGTISPETVDRIGRVLMEQLDTQPITAFDTGPVERVGAILNFSPAGTREEVLEGLGEDDKEFAEAVRKAIFTFANIPSRVDARDIPKITKDIDQTQLVMALAAATGELEASAEYILSAMSKRLAEQLQEEIAAVGKVKAADGEAAMNVVVAKIRELEGAGEILLIAEDDEEEDG